MVSPFVQDMAERAAKSFVAAWPVALAGGYIDSNFHSLPYVHSLLYSTAVAAMSIVFSFASRTVRNDEGQRTASLTKPVEYAGPEKASPRLKGASRPA